METITQLIDSSGPEIINFTKELIATPSETPTGDERSITQLIKARLNKLGLSGAEVASEVLEHPNIIYRLSGQGRRSDAALCCPHGYETGWRR